MFTAAFFWRVLIAAIAVCFIWLILPPFFEVLKVHQEPAMLTILRLCVAAIAIFYVLRGPGTPGLL